MSLVKNRFIFILLIMIKSSQSYAQDEISSSPLINLENLKPSYEEEENFNLDESKIIKLKEKKKIGESSNVKMVNLIGLDKITAKTSKIDIKIGETRKFGVLQIKALKCGVVKSSNTNSKAAYIQVKDVSKSQNEKVFIFNGWTFSSNPSLAPIDHAIYDIWLVGCSNT